MRNVRALQTNHWQCGLLELQESFQRLRQRAQQDKTAGSHSQSFLEVASLAVTAAESVFEFKLHDVQIAGAAAAASSTVVEMQTGEGKTIVCALAALIRSAFDSSVHVATTTEYLAQRDFESNLPLFQALGIDAGLLSSEASPAANRNAYRSPVTYGAGYLFGFDYLRDQVTLREQEKVVLGREVLNCILDESPESKLNQLEHQTIIVDEADSVLLDEATTPLILSGTSQCIAPETERLYELARSIACSLTESEHFLVEGRPAGVSLTEAGQVHAHEALTREHNPQLQRPWTEYIKQALFAEYQLRCNVDYVVDDDRVKLVDRNTGRIFEDRQLRAGLHQAVEAKEGVTIRASTEAIARVSRQRFFQLYENVCGLTGTIRDNESEVEHFYRSRVHALPTHKTCRRIELPTRFFVSREAKIQAIVHSCIQVAKTERPVLVGTESIDESLEIFELLKAKGQTASVLNGLQDADEAEVIAEAGRFGAVTIATNMAGRGTDIRLDEVARELGGLHVIACSRQTSSRIDRQLAGRCARQGDPGSCQFFVSAEDRLFQEHAPILIAKIQAAATEGRTEVQQDFGPEIERLQQELEVRSFELRKDVFTQDEWLNQVRHSLANPGEQYAH
ncbi:MAG: preprotein translocase subunit SecA [Planctomycetota bacterium]